MNQRARSSVAWLRNVEVCGLSTPSRCVCTASDAFGRAPLICASTDVTKLTRSTTVLDEIHESLLGHPLTSGGSKRLCPIPEPDPAITFEAAAGGAPSARAAWTMNSAGDLTRLR